MMNTEIEHFIAKNRYGSYCVPKSSAYTYTSQTILAGKIHEPTTIRFITSHCGDGDIVHAGAGFGDFLPALAKACKGTVYAYEPNAENFLCANKTLEINGLSNVELANVGLGAKHAQKYVKTGEDGLSLGPRSETVESVQSNGEFQACDILPLDSAVLSRNISIIHLDTEGYEFEILRGAMDIIQKCAPLIILEIDGQALKYNSFMRNLGYAPVKQLIYDAREMVFVNTVYRKQV